jgi:hypothetical protein
MADDEINPLGTPTTNYGWIKPTVGGDDDAWGGLLNTDLDGIDSTVKSVSTVANAAYPASNPAGYITASAIPAPYVLPTASTTVLGGVKVDGSTVTIAGGTISSSGGAAPSSTPPLMDGIVAVGTGTTFARADHVHPTDTHSIGDNRIINGDMRIDQRNNGASGTTGGYTVDRWAYYGAQTKFSWQRVAMTPVTFGFNQCLLFTCSAAYTPIAADVFELYQPIEADTVGDLMWGTPQAQPLTLSFYAFSNLVGTFSGAVQNYLLTRSYPFTFSLPTAGAWTKCVVTIPGDMGGTWVQSGNAGAMHLMFDLGCGLSKRGPANAWTSASYIGVTGSVSLVGTTGANLGFTGVKLEIGSVATPFNRQSLAKSMADCQRYYEKSYNAGTVPGTATMASGEFFYASGPSSGLASGGMSTRFSVAKRSQPTITIYSGLTGSSGAIFDQNSNVDVAATLLTVGEESFGWYGFASVPSGINFVIQWTADAEL